MALALLASACGAGGSASVAPRAPAEAAAAAPAWRLPRGVSPKQYRLTLELDPASPEFQGSVDIDVAIDEPTRVILLNARGLRVDGATASANGAHLAASTQMRTGADPRAEPDVLELRFEHELSGQATLTLPFVGEYRKDLRGLYRVESGDHYYSFSQFEPMDARSAFPCFDEPDQKVPFTVTLRVPSGQQGFSNMNEVERREADGWTTLQFATSPPMPTYLLAFAAGPLDVLPYSRQGDGPKQRVPTRLLAPQGKSERGRLALQMAVEHLALLEEYFGHSYPYPKLDIVAVPEFAAGAMENPGLVTFREERLLVTPDSSLPAIRSVAGVVAHELSHMWFGDFVTMRWWDDLWLNEGFATWMATKIVNQWRPELEARQNFLGWLSSAMDQDSAPSARAIRQAVRTQTDAYRAFSGITYAKGAGVLSMVEQWVGPDAFREGVRSYMQQHAFGNATSSDLFEALGSGAHPVGEVMDSFTSQPGVPLVELRWSCEEKGIAVDSSQRPYVPLGVDAPDPTRRWKIPVCIGYPEGEENAIHCTLLTQAEQHWTVPTSQCPDWVAPNADRNGYYYSSLTAEALGALSRAPGLSPRESIGWMVDAGAMFEAGELGAPDYLEKSAVFLARGERPSASWQQFATTAHWMHDDFLPPERRPLLEGWLRRLLAPKISLLGLTSKPGDADSVRLKRDTLTWAAGGLARDPLVLQWAAEQADRFLKDPQSVAGDDASRALPIAGSLSSGERLSALSDFIASSPAAEHRTLALQAASATRDPDQAVQLLTWVLEGRVTVSDYRYLIPPLLSSPYVRSKTYPWFVEHFDELVDRIPLFSLRRFIDDAIARCTLEGFDDIEAFFAPRLQKLEGMDGVIDSARERTSRCAALREKSEDSLVGYLQSENLASQ